MDKVTISNLQGESGNANIVRYFQNNGMEYLIYSLNEVDESGYTRLYVANIKGIDGNYTAETLNEAEWTEIKNLVKIIVKANKENLPVPVQDLNPHKIKNIILKDKKIFKLNTPLVNDLAANKPNFESTDDTSSESQSGLVQPAFEMPSTPTFESPVQPTFEMPSTPTFESPVQPAFEMPSTPTFENQVQPAFEMPSTPTFESPVQPAFEMPSTPTFENPAQPAFENPVQPAFEMPSTPTFESPVQPAFEMPSTPTFESPVQSAFEMPNTPTFESPVQPAFEMPSTPTFDFSGTNISNNGISQNANLESRIKELEEENKRLAGEIDKYKSIIVNIKETIEN